MEPQAKDRRTIEGIVQDAITQARDFVESEITPDRIKAQRYMDGECDIGYEDGRSKVVATKVRDTVKAIKPSLMRVFMSTAKPVEFVPRGPEDVAMCESATEYMHYVFSKNDGYRVINDAFHDALVKKMGVVKAYWETRYHTEIFTYTDLTEEEMMVIVEDDDVEVLEQITETKIDLDPMGMEIEIPKYSIKISRQMPTGQLRIDSVPTEEFFIDSQARTLDDAYVVAHCTEVRVGDLVEMGYAYEDVFDLDSLYGAETSSQAEDIERRGYSQDDYEDAEGDPSMRLVALTEAYMRMDVDGTGVPVLHRFICGGSNFKLLDFEPCDMLPFAIFEVQPEPHSIYGRSVAEQIWDDQDAATAILRGILDNVALTNNPRLGIVDGAVNVDDVLNNEIGAIVRMRAPGSVQDLAVPFVAGQTLTALTYMDQLVEGKTGVTRASMGLDPDAMQSTTKAAVTATVQAAAGQVEVMVRNLSDGMARLFKILLDLHVRNVDEELMMRIDGDFKPVDPRNWDTDLDVTINVGLGTGREEEKMVMLNQALQQQIMVYQTYGPQNGLVSLTNIRNTMADLLAAAGIRNADRYFQPMNPQIEQQMMMAQQQAQQQQAMMAQQQTDPATMMMQAENMKAQTRAQVDMMKAQMDNQRKVQEMLMDDDLQRDKMAQDLLVDAATVAGKYGTAVDVAAIKAEQERQRQILK